MKSIIGLNMLYSSLIAPSFAFDMMVNIFTCLTSSWDKEFESLRQVFALATQLLTQRRKATYKNF